MTKQKRTRKPPDVDGEYWVKLKGIRGPFRAKCFLDGINWFWARNGFLGCSPWGDIEWRSVEPETEPEWEDEISDE